jgi:dTDP-glucose pyrophosphorylase
MSAVFGRTTSAMVPVNGRPAIHWLISYLYQNGIRRFVIGVRSEEQRLCRFVERAFGQLAHVDFVPLDFDYGPGYTLHACLQKLPLAAPCLIVLGDTLFEFPANVDKYLDRNFVLTGKVDETFRWCLAEADTSGKVLSLLDKPELGDVQWPALVGVYYFVDSMAASIALKERFDNGGRNLQLRHALQPYIASRQLDAIPAAEWYDCGNLDRLMASRRHLLQERSFNRLTVDDMRGTLTKRSEHTQKFLDEINYYRLIPQDLAIFFPRCLDFSIRPSETHLTLEYYGYPTLSELWTFEDLGPRVWRGILKGLSEMLKLFGGYTINLDRTSCFEFYWKKTLRRMEEFASSSTNGKTLVSSESIRLNGSPLDGWERIAPLLESEVRKLCQRVEGRFIHGDFCFPNILYDPVSQIFKLLDPRGSFVGSGVFGDGRYDVAKLFHSLEGGYDFLIHDMFISTLSGTDVDLQMFTSAAQPDVQRHAEEIFGASYDLHEIRVIEALLFLSMCPLHADHPDRQVAMFATGLKLAGEVLH